jgi:hypothetical protein
MAGPLVSDTGFDRLTPPPRRGGASTPAKKSTTKNSNPLGSVNQERSLATVVINNKDIYDIIRNYMVNTKLVSKNGSFTSVENVWKTIYTNTALTNLRNKGKAQITPYDYLLQLGQRSLKSGSGAPGGGGGGGGGGGTTSQTQRSVNISSAKDAKALINQSFQQSVGRDATDDEIKQFRSALNAEEKKNPSITKTTQTVSGSNVSTTNQTTGGMDRGAYALEQGQKASDYAEFQTETTYMDALMRAISGGGQ